MGVLGWRSAIALCCMSLALAGCPDDSDGVAADAPHSEPDDTPGPIHLGGQVSGLAAGETLKLMKNRHEFLSVAQNGAFAFPNGVLDGAHYEIDVTVQPRDQRCRVSGGKGTIAGPSVNTIHVKCESRKQAVLTVSNFEIDSFVVDAKMRKLTRAIDAPFRSDPLMITDFAIAPSGSWGVASDGGQRYADGQLLSQNKVKAYSIDTTSGNLKMKLFAFPDLTDGPFSIGFTSTGERLIALKHGDRTALSQRVDRETGDLIGAPDVQSMTHSPCEMAIDPGGEHVYSIDAGATCVLTTSKLDPQTGAITAVSSLPIAVAEHDVLALWCSERTHFSGDYHDEQIHLLADRPQIKINPQGTRLFVSIPGAHAVDIYAVDPHTRLPVFSSSANLGEGSVNAIALSPDDSRLYASDGSSSHIFGFGIDDPTGRINNLKGSPYPTTTTMYEMATDASQTFVYGLSLAGNLESFSMDPETGALSKGAWVPTVSAANRIVLTP